MMPPEEEAIESDIDQWIEDNMDRHMERQKLLNRLNFLNETLCDILDKKIEIMAQEKNVREEELKVKSLLANNDFK